MEPPAAPVALAPLAASTSCLADRSPVEPLALRSEAEEAEEEDDEDEDDDEEEEDEEEEEEEEDDAKEAFYEARNGNESDELEQAFQSALTLDVQVNVSEVAEDSPKGGLVKDNPEREREREQEELQLQGACGLSKPSSNHSK